MELILLIMAWRQECQPSVPLWRLSKVCCLVLPSWPTTRCPLNRKAPSRRVKSGAAAGFTANATIVPTNSGSWFHD